MREEWSGLLGLAEPHPVGRLGTFCRRLTAVPWVTVSNVSVDGLDSHQPVILSEQIVKDRGDDSRNFQTLEPEAYGGCESVETVELTPASGVGEDVRLAVQVQPVEHIWQPKLAGRNDSEPLEVSELHELRTSGGAPNDIAHHLGITHIESSEIPRELGAEDQAGGHARGELNVDDRQPQILLVEREGEEALVGIPSQTRHFCPILGRVVIKVETFGGEQQRGLILTQRRLLDGEAPTWTCANNSAPLGSGVDMLLFENHNVQS